MSNIDEKSLQDFLRTLKNRKPDTKYQLLKLLIGMGKGWHSFTEIKEYAEKKEIGTHHLDENLIELSRVSGFLKTDLKEKRFQRLTSFEIDASIFPVLEKALNEL
jgi:hypothetical protein